MSSDRTAITVDEYWPEDAEESEAGIVANWFVREGAHVDEGDTLCEVQVEKVSADIVAPVEGELVEIILEEDAEFDRGDTLAWIVPE